MQNTIYSFELTLYQAGFEPIELHPDREFRRCYVKGDRSGTKNGWYVLNQEADRFWGVYGSHKTSERHTWASRDRTGFGVSELTHKQVKKPPCPIATIWDSARAPDPSHTYLIKKHVSGEGLRQSGRQLLIPYRDIHGKLMALGTIKPDGTKLLLRGSKPRGAFMTLGTILDRVLICEGYATAASCYLATQVATVVAGSAENLVPVACAIREQNPKLEIVIMADDDHECAVNKGLRCAKEAAANVGGIVLIPSEFYFFEGRV